MNEKDAYRKLWSGKPTAEPYLQWLARGDDGRLTADPLSFSVVDVMISGHAEHYELVSPSSDMSKIDFYQSDEMQLWLQVTRQHLSAFKSEVETRIIIFSPESDITIRNLLGTKYDLGPEFFADIQHQDWMISQWNSGSMMGTGNLSWPAAYQAFNYATGSEARHLKFGNGFVACVVQDTVSNPDGKKNVVLVCSVSARYKATSVAQFCRSGFMPMSEMPWHVKSDPYLDPSKLYLAGILRTRDEARRAANENPLLYLLPILQVQCDTVAGDLGYHYEVLHCHMKDRDTLTSNHEALEISWRELRSLLWLGPKPFHAFKCFDRCRNGKRSSRNKEYLAMVQNFSQLMKEVQSLEQLARDYMQLSVGILSLAESRASIKQSKIALEESKRTKLVTVLAFVFVPLSIGTSTFGMNLNELNGNGPRLWVFGLTATIIFILSGFLWAILSQVHKYYRLKECPIPEASPEKSSSGGSLPVAWHFRLRLFLRLVLHGHLFWIWRSGIAFSLATSGRKGFLRSCTSCAPFSGKDLEGRERLSDPAAQETVERYIRRLQTHDEHSPCAYIMRHLEEDVGFDCKNLEHNE